MDDIVPFFTLDGSVGLYSKSEDDIFHSVYGALSEAYDKFILPANLDDYFKNNKEIKILDLCYGIGYNSKSFLNYFFQKRVPLTESNDTVYTDNISKGICTDTIHNDNILNSKYNNTIHVNNIFAKLFFNNSKNNKNNNSENKNFKIKIDAVDINDNLMKLSPLLTTKSMFDKYDDIGIEKVDRYLNSGKTFKKKYKLKKEVNMLILMALLNNLSETYLSKDFCKLLEDLDWKNYISKDMCRFMKFYITYVSNSIPRQYKSSFLHNIYYKHISKSYKNTLKVLENNEISFRSIIDDARHFLLSNDFSYDLIFLDAFTPSKCPNLWTYDFFKLLYSHLSEQGKILTYSNSASVRNAFLQSGFYIGKIYNKNEDEFTGTIAVKNPNYIKYNLSEYERGLLNTKAGIMYSDEYLNDKNENIIERRNVECEQSSLISATKYKNNYKGDKNEI